jgi:thiamine-phosphate pyrophosphorylase
MDGLHLSHAEQTKIACEAGARWIQVRVKQAPYPEWNTMAAACVEICHAHKAICIINDNVQIAYDTGADGVHLGATDMHPAEARKILGSKKIIGGTAHNIHEFRNLNDSDVNYIGLGPYRYTATKNDLSDVLGIENVTNIMQAHRQLNSTIPVFAIGGIQLDDISPIMSAGVQGIAVASAIFKSPDIRLSIQNLQTSLQSYAKSTNS